MTATVEFVQFRKTSGMSSNVTVVAMDKDPNIGWGFFGQPQLSGYNSPPLVGAATQYPVKAGSVSWQVWTAARVVGYDFTIVNRIRLIVNEYFTPGIGTIATQNGVTAKYTQGAPPAASGLFARTVPGTLELNTPNSPLENAIPVSAPSYGLPLPTVAGGWLLLQEYEADDGYIDIVEATEAVPANSIDLTPFREQVGEISSKGIYSSDPEDRLSNFAVMNFVLSSDAIAGVIYPVDVGVTWNES
ncbi:MAG: hypothetical protein ACI88C_000039 [Acidimicrobiales bacterium]|jgi:hypothetical protein